MTIGGPPPSFPSCTDHPPPSQLPPCQYPPELLPGDVLPDQLQPGWLLPWELPRRQLFRCQSLQSPPCPGPLPLDPSRLDQLPPAPYGPTACNPSEFNPPPSHPTPFGGGLDRGCAIVGPCQVAPVPCQSARATDSHVGTSITATATSRAAEPTTATDRQRGANRKRMQGTLDRESHNPIPEHCRAPTDFVFSKQSYRSRAGAEQHDPGDHALHRGVEMDFRADEQQRGPGVP